MSLANASARQYCCEHAAGCAVHEEPYDAQYVSCSCPVGMGSLRHEHNDSRAKKRGGQASSDGQSGFQQAEP